MDSQKILIVEDDAPVRNLIITTLETNGYAWLESASGQEALMTAASHNPSIILLDLGLPDMEGTEVIRRIRSWSAVPIIVISARSEDRDKIEALDCGADDYMSKPFSVEELLARLRATFRRLRFMQAQAGGGLSPYTNGKLLIDPAANIVTMDGEELHLTPTEYKLLCLLANNTGKVLTYRFITQGIWGSSWENNMATLRVVMTSLRKKLDCGDEEPMIQTHVGIGYRMVRL